MAPAAPLSWSCGRREGTVCSDDAEAAIGHHSVGSVCPHLVSPASQRHGHACPCEKATTTAGGITSS